MALGLASAGMSDGWLGEIRASYDTVASSYADLLRYRLDGQPYLRAALAVFAELVRAGGGGPVVDVGCGPGQVTALLGELGMDVSGVDLSPGMVDIARREHPGIRFEVGSMTDLGIADGSLGGLLAFWSLIHIPDDEVPAVLTGFRCALRPGAPLLLGFHAGEGSTHKTEGYGGHPMNVHVHRRTPARISSWLRDAGFTVEAELLLDPYTPRPGAIVIAHCPSGGADRADLPLA